MEHPKRKISWGRMAIAIFIAYLHLGSIIPSTGRVVADHSTFPPTTHIEGRFCEVSMLVAGMLLPLICIFWGARRSRALEAVGWILLLGVIAGIQYERHLMFKSLEERYYQRSSRSAGSRR